MPDDIQAIEPDQPIDEQTAALLQMLVMSETDLATGRVMAAAEVIECLHREIGEFNGKID